MNKKNQRSTVRKGKWKAITTDWWLQGMECEQIKHLLDKQVPITS